MENTPQFPPPEVYIARVNRQLGAELRARREALPLTPYALGLVSQVSDQTILNIERGDTCPHLKSLLMLCVFFKVTLAEFTASAERRTD